MLALLVVALVVSIIVVLTSKVASKDAQDLGLGQTYVKQINIIPIMELSPSDLINSYNWNKQLAYRVMMAESGGNSNAENFGDYHYTGNCYGSFGLFQLACFRGSIEDLKDPETNVRLAYELWLSNNKSFKGHWGVCRYISC